MRARPKAFLLLAAAVLVSMAAVLPAGCSSQSAGSRPCNESPWQCGPGTTCWPDCACPSGATCTLSNCTPQYACLTSRASVTVGDNCTLQNGSPQCGDMQTCVSFADAGPGICEQFCGENKGCPPSYVCVGLTAQGGGSASSAVEYVCVPPADDEDGGFGVDSGSGSGSGSGGGSGGSSSGAVDADISDVVSENIQKM